MSRRPGRKTTSRAALPLYARVPPPEPVEPPDKSWYDDKNADADEIRSYYDVRKSERDTPAPDGEFL